MVSPRFAGSTLSEKSGRLSTFFKYLVHRVGADPKRATNAADRCSLLKMPFDSRFFLGSHSTGFRHKSKGLLAGFAAAARSARTGCSVANHRLCLMAVGAGNGNHSNSKLSHLKHVNNS